MIEFPAAVSFDAGSRVMPWQRPTRLAQPREFNDEKLARAYIEAHWKQHFWLIPEVRLEHWSGKKLKIDYIAIPRDDAFRTRAPIIGIEVKRGYESFSKFSSALRQSIDYRQSVIVDQRSKRHHSASMPFVFLFPAITPIDGSSPGFGSWIKGSVRLAGQFSVGVIDDGTFWLSGHPWWSASHGLHGLDAWWQAAKVGAR